MHTLEARDSRAYCLFACRSWLLAVGVEAVEVVIEAARLVRLPLCPRPVWALCTYRGGFLPIVRPGDEGEAAPAREPAVLVLRTRHGSLGLLIDRGDIAIVEDGRVSGGADRAAPGAGDIPLPEGLVAAGAIERDGDTYTILDLDRTWMALRGLIERGYGAGRRIGGPAASPPGGERAGGRGIPAPIAEGGAS